MNPLRAVLIMLLAMLTGCSDKESDPIFLSLTRLRTSGRSDAFVIVVDPATQRYVQFSVFPDREVHFDFPLRATFMTPEVRGLWYHLSVENVPTEGVARQTVLMEPQEVERLRRFLADRRLSFHERRMAGTYFDGPIEGYMESMDGVLPDLRGAKAFVDDVFSHVYQLAVPKKYSIRED